ncbi:hypothetical protein G6R29_01205 [Fructobacillus sp. M2-14]|uniref:Integral membrane protein n=1 Tax=Fructobacillus broussonetiae TaxID=2713173 RepID=A0ABS5QZS9_9LACO|nr:hypothetical protein [Fructobacillus broussonetiae]MBS9338252.1 hypothetical protein [Fructobacillus broussonetiae]
MNRFKEWVKRPVYFWSAMIVLVTVILPMIASWLNLSTLTKVIALYFLINGLFALAFGAAVKHQGWKLPVLLAQPLTFGLLGTALFGFVNDTYGYYLALLYLVLAMFTYLNAEPLEPSLDELPVDGGYQDV